MIDLRDKRVLFFAPKWFGYEDAIIEELRRRGAEVDYLADRPFDSALMKAAARFARPAVLKTTDRVYQEALETLGRPSYDVILVIRGQTVSSAFMRELARQYPTARRILYMWDSIENQPYMAARLDEFDDCLSFDPASARQYGMRLRPTFFIEQYERQPNASPSWDLSFVGTAHSDRTAIVRRLRASLPDSARFYDYQYLQAPWVYHAYKVLNPNFRGASRDEFHFRPLDAATVSDLFFDSRALLDIEHPRQSGLTQRPFSAMAAQKKLVTTTAAIRDYDFYDAQNIAIIDRHAPSLPDGFLETDYRPIPADLYRKYSVGGWLDEILGG